MDDFCWFPCTNEALKIFPEHMGSPSRRKLYSGGPQILLFGPFANGTQVRVAGKRDKSVKTRSIKDIFG